MNTETQSTAEIYFMAFQSLSEKEKEAVIARLLEDESLREDILDITLIRERQKEPGRPFREYLKARGKRSN